MPAGVGEEGEVVLVEVVGVRMEMRKVRDEKVVGVAEEEGRTCKKLGKGNDKDKMRERGPTW